MEEKITRASSGGCAGISGLRCTPCWHAIKFLEFDGWTEAIIPGRERDFWTTTEKQIINEKYDYIEEVIQESLMNKEE